MWVVMNSNNKVICSYVAIPTYTIEAFSYVHIALFIAGSYVATRRRACSE